MTNHHDELASAYLDGQLSPEEATRVESDPSLLARADALASVVERLQADEAPVDPVTRGRHLAAALDAFDQLVPSVTDQAASGQPVAAPADTGAAGTGLAGVIDLSDAAHRRTVLEGDVARRTARLASSRATGAGPGTASALRRHRRRSMPTWLSAAAGLVIIGGGLAWFASQQSGDESTSANFDTGAALTTAAGQEGSADAALAQSTEGGGAANPAPAAADGATADKALGAGASDESTASAEAAPPTAAASTRAPAVPSSTNAAAASSAAPTTGRPSTTSTAPPSTPVTAPPTSGPLSFASTPTGEQVRSRVASSGQALLPAGSSACGASVSPPAGASPTGYVTITVAGVPGEGLFYQGGSGGAGAATVLVVRTSTCQPFS